MSPSKRNYDDGVDDGKSDWYDRKRFQDDKDYYDGVKDGWQERQRSIERERDNERQKWEDKADRAMSRGMDEYNHSSSSSYTSYPSASDSPWAIPIMGILIFILMCVVPYYLYWDTVTTTISIVGAFILLVLVVNKLIQKNKTK